MAYCTLSLASALVVALFAFSAVAAPSREVRAADGPHDVNWRIITGIKATYQVMYDVSHHACSHIFLFFTVLYVKVISVV